MVSILGDQPKGYHPLDKFFYEHELNIHALDNRGQASRILRQFTVECILNELCQLWKSQGNFENGCNIMSIPHIGRGSHKGNHMIAVTDNNEMTRLRNLLTYYQKNRGLETNIFTLLKDHSK